MIGLAPYISLALAYGLSVNALPSNLEARATSVTPESFAATQFDVIIVGGGTAGLVVANRLSAKPLKVGVIEAGGYNPAGDPLIDVPYNGGYFVGDPSASVIFNPAYDWSFASIPQPALNGTVIGYPRYVILLSLPETTKKKLTTLLVAKSLVALRPVTSCFGNEARSQSTTHGTPSSVTATVGAFLVSSAT
jgi:hypothetical protein